MDKAMEIESSQRGGAAAAEDDDPDLPPTGSPPRPDAPTAAAEAGAGAGEEPAKPVEDW